MVSYFFSDHQNWFGMDEVLGAVAVSLRREKVPQTSTMGSANGNQSETFIQVSMICSICTLGCVKSLLLKATGS